VSQRKPRTCRGFQGVTIRRKIQGSTCPRRPNTIPKHKSGKARIRDRDTIAPRPPGLGETGGRGHDAAEWAVVTDRSDSELEAKGTEFYAGAHRLIATKEPLSGTNQPGHRSPPSCRSLSLARWLRQSGHEVAAVDDRLSTKAEGQRGKSVTSPAQPPPTSWPLGWSRPSQEPSRR